jgi:hypothetical protein
VKKKPFSIAPTTWPTNPTIRCIASVSFLYSFASHEGREIVTTLS